VHQPRFAAQHFVAVKVLKPEYNQDAEYVARFQREAEAASKMTHHNIVNLLDVGMDSSGNRYLIMEYVEGQTLKDVIREKGRLSETSAVQITIRILSALQHAHSNGIIHRDIKPQNILMQSDGHVKVTIYPSSQLGGEEDMIDQALQGMGIAVLTDAGRLSSYVNDIGIMNMTPPESAVIAADIAVKSGDVYLGFADRFTGTVIITGELADVTSALTEIVNYFRDELGYVVCRITKR